MKFGKWNDSEISSGNRIKRPRNQEKHFLNIKLKFSNMMKYIITDKGPILNPANIPNETFSCEIISSGFCVFWFSNESNRFECFTLPEITATPNDYKIIEKFLNG